MRFLIKFLIAFLFFGVFLAPSISYAAITLNNPSSANVSASADYATNEFADSWDMSNAEDVWNVYSNFNNATFANGAFSGVTTSNSARFYLLWGGYPGSIDTGRDGINHPIDAASYSRMGLRMYSSVSGTAYLYVFHVQDTSINQYCKFGVNAGWHIYNLDNEPDCELIWSGAPIGIRLNPINKSGANFALDWFYIGKASGATTELSWNDDSPGGLYGVYIDDDESGDDGAKIGETSATSGTFNLQNIAPGAYYLYIKKDDGTFSNRVSISVNHPPTIKIIEPDAKGGQDWASTVAANAWDMSNSSDISYTKNTNGRRFSNGVFSGANTNNDPYVYLNLRGKKINTIRYHRFSFKYKYDGTFNLVRGTMSRVGWRNYPNKGWQISDDILTYEGWNTITLSLKKAALDVGRYGWRGYVKTLRFDPHEDTQRRRFYIDEVKLAANDEMKNKVFNIQYKIADADSSNVSYAFYTDKDKSFANGNETLIASGNTNPGNGTITWHPSLSLNGVYNIYAVLSDGINSTSAYSSGPVNVDNVRPNTYTRRVRAKRPSRAKTARYLKLYRTYKSRYKRARNRTLRRRYLRGARRYYRAYRNARKRYVNVKLKWIVKDRYSSNEAYVKLNVQRKIKSRFRERRKKVYLRLYRAYKVRMRKTRNRTLKNRYRRRALSYKTRYRRTKTYLYRTVKRVNYGWTNVNTWRTYIWKTSKPGAYRYFVNAKDHARNSQNRVRVSSIRVR